MLVEGVILAAGFSSRAGQYKMTWPVHGKSMLERSMNIMLTCCERIYVVGGFEFHRLIPVIEKYSQAELVYNPGYAEGMFSSVIQGLSHIQGDRAFIAPGDCPLIGPEIYTRLLSCNSEAVVPAVNGIAGHPVLISKRLIGELLKSKAYYTLREFLADQDACFLEVDDDGILFDADTPEDFSRLETILSNIKI